jgi:hypothetical protein
VTTQGWANYSKKRSLITNYKIKLLAIANYNLKKVDKHEKN